MSRALAVIAARPPARTCATMHDDGLGCRMAPLRDSRYCFSHDPEHREEAARARLAGGVRRRREAVVAVADDLDGLPTLGVARRLLQIVASDTLARTTRLRAREPSPISRRSPC